MEFDWITPEQVGQIAKEGLLRSGIAIPADWLEDNREEILKATDLVALEVLAAFLIENAAIQRSWLDTL